MVGSTPIRFRQPLSIPSNDAHRRIKPGHGVVPEIRYNTREYGKIGYGTGTTTGTAESREHGKNQKGGENVILQTSTKTVTENDLLFVRPALEHAPADPLLTPAMALQLHPDLHAYVKSILQHDHSALLHRLAVVAEMTHTNDACTGDTARAGWGARHRRG
jgi:hypothetical protein